MLPTEGCSFNGFAFGALSLKQAESKDKDSRNGLATPDYVQSASEKRVTSCVSVKLQCNPTVSEDWASVASGN